MYEQLLAQSGLKYPEALIYELLLKEGALNAGKISKKTPIKRGLVYKTLDDLEAKKLVKKTEKEGKVAIFEASHPSELLTLIQKNEEKIRAEKGVLEKVLPQLVSDFTLTSEKPVVKYYEGMEGLQILMDDTLKATSLIYSYTDPEAVEKWIPDIQKSYYLKREKLKKQKRVLVLNSEFNKKYFKKLTPEITDVRFLDFDFKTMGTVMNIYDNKISYSTLNPKSMIGVIIEHKAIAQMQKSLFEYNWVKAVKTETNS